MIIYDNNRHHLTATDRRALKTALERIGTASSIGVSTGRNKYSLQREGTGFVVTIQNGEGQYRVPFSVTSKAF